MRYAIIKNGVTVNFAEADAEHAAEQGWVLAPAACDIGWTHDGQQFTPRVKARPVPMVITQLQFRKALREVGRIAAFRTYANGLTADEREDWQFSPTIRRHEPMVLAAQIAMGVTDAQLDTFFLRAEEL